MSEPQDRLLNLLPYIYRLRDSERGEPLRRFLRVIEEQVEVIEQDLQRSYDNWFIETCEEWVVPYLAELIGYRPVAQAGAPGQAQRAEGRLLRKTLAPRSDVAATLANARRKGTLPLLEELARQTAGWPARAVEGQRLLSYTQPLRHLRLTRGRTAELRDGAALQQLGGAFEQVAHGVDVRRPSARSQGLFGLSSVGVFAWRLRAFPITYAEPYLQEGAGSAGRGCFWFNVLGGDTPLFSKPEPEPDTANIAGPEHVPQPLTRELLERDLIELDPYTGVTRRRADARYYGAQQSFAIWLDRGDGLKLVARERIVSADLSHWQYTVSDDTVLVDPERGRFKVHGRIHTARVSYHVGAAAALGGGEYDRDPALPTEPHLCYIVDNDSEAHASLLQAVEAWATDMEKRRGGDTSIPPAAVIELAARGSQHGHLRIELREGETLIIRAADRNRPVIWLSDNQPEVSDAISVSGTAGSRFVLDGVLVAQRGIELEGPFGSVVLRHCTVVPPRASLDRRESSAASVVLRDVTGDVSIDRCILGPLTVSGTGEPARLQLRNSIIDAAADDAYAISGDGDGGLARASLSIHNCTLFGATALHAIELAENSIFSGTVQVARRQPGCMRFCYVPTGSRTPKRHACQPDLVSESAREQSAALREQELDRVRPVWTSRRFGSPDYARLWRSAPPELTRGADDESELGVFHDLFIPQRTDGLAARLQDFVPAASDAGSFFVT